MGAAPAAGNRFWRIFSVFCVLFALVALAYFFADRQLASALKPDLGGVKLFPKLTHLVDPMGPLAFVGAAVVAGRALARGALTPRELLILRLCCAVLIAAAAKDQLKWAFGRTWPETFTCNNPSYFGNGTYGFFPFHGGQAYASFPSGHTATISAFAGAIWFLCPKMRWLGVALAFAVAIGLLGADFHWLSDIMAGAILGVSIGAAAAKIGRSESGT
jgi:membrane-associated phospholipid phosphatase